jgi:PilZ domain
VLESAEAGFDNVGGFILPFAREIVRVPNFISRQHKRYGVVWRAMQQIRGHRVHPRVAKILATEIVELPRGAKLQVRTSDVSRSGCYVDTLNAIPEGSHVLVRMNYRKEVFEATGRVIYVSPGLGMGICFVDVDASQQSLLDRWLAEADEY